MKWNKVEDELPQTTADCLVYNKNDEIMISSFWKNEWDEFLGEIPDVSHWIYLSQIKKPSKVIEKG